MPKRKATHVAPLVARPRALAPAVATAAAATATAALGTTNNVMGEENLVVAITTESPVVSQTANSNHESSAVTAVGPRAAVAWSNKKCDDDEGEDDDNNDDDGVTLTTRPNTFDVLLGRGKSYWKRKGNQKYNELLHQYLDPYRVAPMKDKYPMAKEIVDQIVNSGGKFLRVKGDGTSTVAVSTEYAVRKVCHALQHLMRKEKKTAAAALGGSTQQHNNNDTTISWMNDSSLLFHSYDPTDLAYKLEFNTALGLFVNDDPSSGNGMEATTKGIVPSQSEHQQAAMRRASGAPSTTSNKTPISGSCTQPRQIFRRQVRLPIATQGSNGMLCRQDAPNDTAVVTVVDRRQHAIVHDVPEIDVRAMSPSNANSTMPTTVGVGTDKERKTSKGSLTDLCMDYNASIRTTFNTKAHPSSNGTNLPLHVPKIDRHIVRNSIATPAAAPSRLRHTNTVVVAVPAAAAAAGAAPRRTFDATVAAGTNNVVRKNLEVALTTKTPSPRIASNHELSTAQGPRAAATLAKKKCDVEEEEDDDDDDDGIMTTTSPSTFDVLVGRGRSKGNQEYNELLYQYLEPYRAAPMKDKYPMAEEIVHQIVKSGGKFLRVKGDGSTVAVSTEYAVRKVCHALQHMMRKEKKAAAAFCSAQQHNNDDTNSWMMNIKDSSLLFHSYDHTDLAYKLEFNTALGLSVNDPSSENGVVDTTKRVAPSQVGHQQDAMGFASISGFRTQPQQIFRRQVRLPIGTQGPNGMYSQHTPNDTAVTVVDRRRLAIVDVVPEITVGSMPPAIANSTMETTVDVDGDKVRKLSKASRTVRFVDYNASKSTTLHTKAYLPSTGVGTSLPMDVPKIDHHVVHNSSATTANSVAARKVCTNLTQPSTHKVIGKQNVSTKSNFGALDDAAQSISFSAEEIDGWINDAINDVLGPFSRF